MKPSFRKSYLLAMGLILAAASPAPRAMPPGFSPIAMSLTPNRQTYWVGEPVVLKCRIANWLSPQLVLTMAFGIDTPEGELRIVFQGEEGEPYLGPHTLSQPWPTKYPVRYAKALEFPLMILYSGKTESKLALETPGVYRATYLQNMAYDNWYLLTRKNVDIQVSTLSPPFKVIAPPPEAQGALDILRSRPSLLRDLNRRLASPANRSLLRRVADEYPESRYAPYCLDALSNLAAKLGASDSAVYEGALRDLGRIVAQHKDYVFRDEARKARAEILNETGHLDAAVKIVNELIAEDEDNLFRFRKSPLFRPVIGPKTMIDVIFNETHWYLFDTTELPDASYFIQIQPE